MRLTFWAAVTALAVAAVGGMWLTSRRIAPRELAPLVAPDLQVKFERVTVRGRAGDDRWWELEAESVELTKDQRLTRLDGLRHASLYYGKQRQLTARAAWARLQSPAGDLELGGGVEVTSPAGLVLRAERLRWQARPERLDSAGPVTMTMGDTTVRAPRASYSARTQRIVCDGGVQIAQGRDRLRADRLTVDLAAETLELAGGVRMRARVREGRELAEGEGLLGAMPKLLEKAPREGR
jgi:LPS export ABC transporter protein LptC